MNDTAYYILCGVFTVGVLAGISLMSKVKTAFIGNWLSALCMAGAIALTLIYFDVFDGSVELVFIGLAIGLVIGVIWTIRAKMIAMPQLVALFNGFGGAASAFVGIMTFTYDKTQAGQMNAFARVTAMLAVAVGMVTLTGSLVAAAKLQNLMSQRPVIWKIHRFVTTASLVVITALCILAGFHFNSRLTAALYIACFIVSAFFGVAFAIRVGGADMPITISLLNSFSGVAGSIAGLAIGDPLLVAIGGIVGASGLLLTQIMCRAMNRSLSDILLGKTSVAAGKSAPEPAQEEKAAEEPEEREKEEVDLPALLKAAKNIIIVPGYGMALAQAQESVKRFADLLEANGAQVRYAIHPVAGRMPGHMNVLLCEVDVPYDQLYEMDDINPEFEDCDIAVIIGANDVVNPAARDAEGTPIYGMPVLSADSSKHIVICNYDLKPGYAGVPNPLYDKKQGVTLLLGDAKESLSTLIDALQ